MIGNSNSFYLVQSNIFARPLQAEQWRMQQKGMAVWLYAAT